MSTEVAIPASGRRLTCCCADHKSGPAGSCCDSMTCLPCCAECPSCPRWAFFERFNPGWRKSVLEDQRRWLAEFRGERWALVEIGRALEWWDRGARWRVVSARPDVAQIVRTVRRVRAAVWGQEVPF